MPTPIEPEPTAWVFPPVDQWLPDDDLVAVGADLAPGTLLAAYRRGLFPMPAGGPTDPVAWWSPVRRGVLRLGDLSVSRSLRRSARDFEIRVDTSFERVLAHCGDPSRPDGWIDDRIARAYTRLHRMGWAHSVETWAGGELVGGLYGVSIGGLFAGESMFHLQRDASKVALVGLVDLLRDEYADQRLIDVQWQTPHLATLGVSERSREEFLAVLPGVLEVPAPSRFAGV